MKRWLAALIFCFTLAQTCWPEGIASGVVIGGVEGISVIGQSSTPPSTPFSITYQTNATLAAASCPANVCTFSAQPIGGADPTRIVAIGILVRPAASLTTVSSVTIGGIAATQGASCAVQVSNNTLSADIWYLAVPTGTTSTIVVTVNNTIVRETIGIWSVVGTSSAFSACNTAQSTSASTLSASVSTPSGGGAIAVGNNDGTPSSVTMTNLTSDFSGPLAGNQWPGGGHDASHSGSTSYGMTWNTGGDAILSVGAFSP